MSLKSLSYWFACTVAAVIAVGAAEPNLTPAPDLRVAGAGLGSAIPMPDTGRTVLLFAGIMAMAFTYRCAWVSWRRGTQG
ncbi:hypothetical protein [Prosthecobacter sp.]|uniref:hypothetical protein n=1 Tax=Prosthecobacter sp. TaxID=1965333 RepID=UPI00378468D1